MAISIQTKWPAAKIRDLCDVSRGASPRPINDHRFFEGGDIPWIKIADATKSGKFLYETKEYVNKYGASFSKILPVGTIIVAASGTLGYTQILGVPGCAHDGWLILTNLRNFDRDYAYYVLRLMQKHFYNSAYGAAIQNINTNILRETEIPLPPLPTQQNIASILSTYDDLIENSLKRIKILEEMAQNLYREWFVKFRFPGYENTRFVDSQIGRIPEGWKVRTLDSLISNHIGGGWGKETKDHRHTEPAWVIRGTDIPPAQRGSVSNLPFRYHDKSNLKSRILSPGDIIFEVSGGSKDQPLGRTLYISSGLIEALDGLPVICASFCKRITPNSKDYASEILYLSFKEAYESGEIEQYQVQSTGISNYKWSSYIENVYRCVPTIRIQNSFCDIITPIFSDIVTLGRKNAILSQTRDLLLPKFISGEVDVSDLDISISKEIEV